METATLKKLLFLPAIIVGILVFVALIKNRAEPEKIPLAETARTVRIIEAPQVTMVPTLKSTGTVQPSHVWNGVAQVSGKIEQLHPQLKKGSVIQENVVILKIDPSDYDLAIEQAKTNIEATKAQLAESKVREKNSKASLKIEQKALRIGKEELVRKGKLVADGTVTRSDYEKEERNVLAQQQNVQSLQNALNLYPAERRRLQADISRLQSQLKNAQLNLERTSISMPFTARIVESKVEIKQFVRQGEILVVADGIGKAEIEVDIPMGRLSGLIRSDAVFNASDISNEEIGHVLGLTATVLLKRNSGVARWDGRIVRTSDTMDPRTRTIGFFVEVDNPYQNIQPGVKPPLVKGMFVEVEIKGKPIADQIVVPRSAVTNNQLFIINDENRLQRREVITSTGGANYVVVKNGLMAGERVVISDLLPAIDGMLLNPTNDTDTLNQLISEAQASHQANPL